MTAPGRHTPPAVVGPVRGAQCDTPSPIAWEAGHSSTSPGPTLPVTGRPPRELGPWVGAWDREKERGQSEGIHQLAETAAGICDGGVGDVVHKDGNMAAAFKPPERAPSLQRRGGSDRRWGWSWEDCHSDGGWPRAWGEAGRTAVGYAEHIVAIAAVGAAAAAVRTATAAGGAAEAWAAVADDPGGAGGVQGDQATKDWDTRFHPHGRAGRRRRRPGCPSSVSPRRNLRNSGRYSGRRGGGWGRAGCCKEVA